MHKIVKEFNCESAAQKKKKKNSIEFFGRRADLRAILTSISLSWRHKNVHILEACTGIMWLR